MLKYVWACRRRRHYRGRLLAVRGVSEAAASRTPERSYGGVQSGRAFYSQGHVDDKNAARTRQVAKIDFAPVHSDGLSSDGEAETGPVGPAPVGERLERVDSAPECRRTRPQFRSSGARCRPVPGGPRARRPA